MNPGYTFAADDRINAAVPELHTHSMEVAQETLQPGDFIEIGIERKPDKDGDGPFLVESVFARVEAVNWPFIDAVIHSQVRFSKFHGLHTGDVVSCSEKQILCFLPSENSKTESWIEFVTEKAVEMQRAFLATLVLNELPQDCFTRCVLDADTTVLIRPIDGKFVGVNVAESHGPAVASTTSKTNDVDFHEAAKRLGFHSFLPGQFSSTPRNQLVLSLEPSASGQELVDSVVKSVEQVRQEVTRVLAERGIEGKQS